MSTFTLFLNDRIVCENLLLDGGVLVNQDGVIEKILEKNDTEEWFERGAKVVDTSGTGFLMAGIVDSHVHVNEPGRTHWEGFRSGSAAAAAGGVTTIVDMPLNSIPPTTTVNNLNTKLDAARDNIFVDCAFWGGVIPSNAASIYNTDFLRFLDSDLLKLIEAGVVGFKCFLCPSGVDEFPNVTEEDLRKAFSALNGSQTVLAFHAELESPSESKVVSGGSLEYSTYLHSRPDEMEVEAIKLISKLAPEYDVPIHIVHVSSAEAIEVIEALRKKRKDRCGTVWNNGVTAETCHHYLTFNSESIPQGRTEYKCSPPIRSEHNRLQLWQHLKEGKLHLVVSDHSPCPADLKCADFLAAWGGISSVQFGLSIFWTEAKKLGFTLHDVTKLMSRHTAKLCGLASKGSLEPGKDADLIIFDPDETFTVQRENVLHKNKLTPYTSMTLTGRVKQTYLRGELIFSDEKVSSIPYGKLLIK